MNTTALQSLKICHTSLGIWHWYTMVIRTLSLLVTYTLWRSPYTDDAPSWEVGATLQILPGYTLQDLLLILIQAHGEGGLDTDNLDLVYLNLGHAELLIEKESK